MWYWMKMLCITYPAPALYAEAEEVKSMNNTNYTRFQRIAQQADAAKANMGPSYGLDVTDMSDEEYLANLKSKTRKRA